MLASKGTSFFYSNEHKFNFLSLGINASLHFFERLNNPLLPYTIRLMSLNLLLFPSANPELSGWDIAFLTGAISLFIPLQKADMLLSSYRCKKTSSLSGELPIIIPWNSLNIVSTYDVIGYFSFIASIYFTNLLSFCVLELQVSRYFNMSVRLKQSTSGGRTFSIRYFALKEIRSGKLFFPNKIYVFF